MVCLIQYMLTWRVLDPGEVLAEPPPQMLVALRGDRPAVGVSQQALAVAESAPALAVGKEVAHQRRRDGLPAYCLAFLVQPDQALLRVQVVRRERQGAAAAACGFHVQPQQERVQGRVVAGRGRDLAQFAEAAIGQCHAGAAEPARFGCPCGRVLGLGEDAVSDQVAVHAPQRADQVLGGAASSAGVPALYGAFPDLLGELADLQRGGLVDPPVSPFPDHFGPVRAVDAPGSRGDRLLHERYVVGDQRDLGPGRGCQQVGGLDS